MRLLEDIMDDMTSVASPDSAHKVASDESETYLLFWSELQKCTFIFSLGHNDYDTDTDPETTREILEKEVPVRYKMITYVADVLLKSSSFFVGDYTLHYDMHDINDFNFDRASRSRTWTADEFVTPDDLGRIPCVELWDSIGYYDKMFVALRVDFTFNDNIELREFIKEMRRIYDHMVEQNLFGEFAIKRLNPELPDGSEDLTPTQKYENNASLIAAYRMLKGFDDDELEKTYGDIGKIESDVKKSYKACSQYVQYLISFEKRNGKDASAFYDFRILGYNEDVYGYEKTLIMIVDAIPRDRKSYGRDMLYRFLMDNIVLPLNVYKNHFRLDSLEIYINDGGAYTPGLKENPETVSSVKINGRSVEVDVCFINQTNEIYPAGRKRTFHRFKEAELIKMKWKRILNHDIYL